MALWVGRGEILTNRPPFLQREYCIYLLLRLSFLKKKQTLKEYSDYLFFKEKQTLKQYSDFPKQ